MSVGKCLFVFLLTAIFFSQSITAQYDAVASPASAKSNRQRGLDMLDEIKEIIELRYYDKNYRGIDLDKRFKEAAEKIKTLEANWQIFRVIAQLVLEFNDSHTKFVPPSRANRVEYGFTMQMIGNNCHITDVKKGSDAEAKGLKIGDQIAAVGNTIPTRENLWKINYLIYSLDPKESIKLYVLNPDGKTEKELQIQASFKSIEERRKEAAKRRNEKKENPYKCKTIDAASIVCKLYTFSVDKRYIDKMMKEVGEHKKLILDLRGNRGGLVKIEEYLTGHFFDRDVKVADFIMRNKTKKRIAKTQKEKTFKGELVVLIDSNSASASEVFSRVIQLEKRGKIVGDVSAGAVMASYYIPLISQRGIAYSVFALNVTIADLVMSDGNRLENVGVIPDHPVGPTGQALFEKVDPVLAYAAGLLGTKLTAEDAGKFYFITKPEEDEEDEEENETDDEESEFVNFLR